MILLTLLLACGRTSSLEPDLARLDQALARSPQELPALRQDLAGIQDPVVRDAAVMGWLETHLDQVPQGEAVALCDLLDGASRQSCERQVSSPHLRGPGR